jgi:two-component system OmpR family sensor kinase
LAVVYSALFAIFVVLLSIFLYSSTSNLLLRSAQAAFPTRAHALRTQLIQEVCSTTSPQPPASFIRQNVPSDVDQVYLLDQSGKILASSDGSLLNQPFPYLDKDFFQKAPSDVNKSFSVHPLNNATSDGLLLSMQAAGTCPAHDVLPAYIALITSYNDEQATLRTILLMLGITSAFMIGMGALIISFFTGIMFKPLSQVTRATRALALGDLEQRVPFLHSNDEIAELAASFNQMANRIQQMFAAQQASERRAQRFVSDASHELRTPITSLRGFTEVLIRGGKDDPETLQRVLSLMKNEAERMTDLVNDLLTLARLDEGHIPTPTDIDLIDVAIESLQEVKKQAPPECKLALELTGQDQLKIRANGAQIKQMLLMLLNNALKYGYPSAQKKILLQLSKKAQYIQLQVIDYGEGIAEDDLPHIFERFYRGQNAFNRSAPVPGTGLGLPIALAIAQAYHGTITACSTPRQETIFTISFPSL